MTLNKQKKEKVLLSRNGFPLKKGGLAGVVEGAFTKSLIPTLKLNLNVIICLLMVYQSELGHGPIGSQENRSRKDI